LQVALDLNAIAEVWTGVDPAGGDVVTLAVTCEGKAYAPGGWPGLVLGEAVTYWSGDRQLVFSALALDFGLLGIGGGSSRHLLVSNPGPDPVDLTVPSDSTPMVLSPGPRWGR
jgi:hypothetical protein